MSLAMKSSLAVLTGLFLGAFFWLWFRYGTEVFIAYSDSFLQWCF